MAQHYKSIILRMQYNLFIHSLMNILLLIVATLLFSQILAQSFTATLALSWLTGFCMDELQNHRQNCQPSLVSLWDNQSHTIHGLWPDTTSPESFGPFNIKIFESNVKLLDDMNNYWPPKIKSSSSNVFLWDHEWTTHGKDYAYILYKLRPGDFPGTVEQRNAALQLAFFQDIINLYKKLNLKRLPAKSYTKSQYAAHIGVSEQQLIFYCYKSNLIREVRLCFQITKAGLTLTNCTKSSSTCTGGGAAIELTDWAMKGQSRVFNYPQFQEDQIQQVISVR